jgi:AAA domain
VTLEELKSQKRWLLWRLEVVNGKETKVPYQVTGRRAMANNPATWNTYAELEPHVHNFSGLGCVLGLVDGVYVWGVDFDKCCDAVTGKFTPEVREVIIRLNTYGEFSPSGTGAHLLGLGPLPTDKPVVRPHPGCKQIEIKGTGFYFTFSGRHLRKTPAELIDRTVEIAELYNTVAAMPGKGNGGLVLRITEDEEARFKKLWAGDASDYDNDHSRADLALVGILAKRHNNNAFLIDEQFCKSGLMREKWNRPDYKWSTVWKVIKGEPVFTDEPEDLFEEDSPTEYLVEPLQEDMAEGWFPKGEVSAVAGPSGAGKTSWITPLLERIRLGQDIYGHKCKPRDYRVLLHDRSKKAMQRTMKSLRLPKEAVERVIRLTAAQQKLGPAEILDAAIEKNPGVEVWLIEGLDLWLPDPNKMEKVGPVFDELQRVATRRDVAVIGTVGSPKQKGKDRYYGRDSMFGSAAVARKVETIVLMNLHDQEDGNSVRRCEVLVRNGRVETMYFEWTVDGLTLTEKPPEKTEAKMKGASAMGLMHLNVCASFKPGEAIVYREGLGARATFFRWREQAIEQGLVIVSGGVYYRAPSTI